MALLLLALDDYMLSIWQPIIVCEHILVISVSISVRNLQVCWTLPGNIPMLVAFDVSSGCRATKCPSADPVCLSCLSKHS